MNIDHRGSLKISVVVTTHNRASLLSRAIDSVLRQTYTNFEIVVVDDDSTDNTYSVVKKYLDKYPNFVYIKNENNIGVAASRNVGVKNTTGALITGLDDDDEFSPDRLDYFIKNHDEKWSFLCTGLSYYSRDGLIGVRCRREVISFCDLLYANRASQAFFLKHRYLEINGQDTNLKAREDYDFWLRMTESYGPALRLPNPTYIVHADHEFEHRCTKKKLEGQAQFLEKHRRKMSSAQYNSQILQTYIAENKRLPIKGLFNLISRKTIWVTIKYYLQSNFNSLALMEKKLISLKTRKA